MSSTHATHHKKIWHEVPQGLSPLAIGKERIRTELVHFLCVICHQWDSCPRQQKPYTILSRSVLQLKLEWVRSRGFRWHKTHRLRAC